MDFDEARKGIGKGKFRLIVWEGSQDYSIYRDNYESFFDAQQDARESEKGKLFYIVDCEGEIRSTISGERVLGEER